MASNEEVALGHIFNIWFLHVGEAGVCTCIHREGPFCLSEVCTYPVVIFMAGQGTFTLLCLDLARGRMPGGSDFATQAGGITPMQKHRCDTAPQLPSAPDLHKMMCEARRQNCSKSIEGTRQARDTRTGQQMENHGQIAPDSKGWRSKEESRACMRKSRRKHRQIQPPEGVSK